MSNPLESNPDPAPAAATPAAKPVHRHPEGRNGAFGLEDGGDFGIGSAVKATVKEFGALDYAYLLPFGKILSVSLMRKKAVRWVVLFGLFPLVLATLAHKFKWGVEASAWWLGGYFCLFWVAYFFGILRPQDKVWRRGVAWALFTVVIGVPILLVAQKLPVISALYSGAESKLFILELLGFVLGVGLLEETCKAIPFFLFALRKKEAIRPRDGIILGMMCGFGFALAEIVQYSVGYWGVNAYFSALATARAIDNPANFASLLPRLADLSGSALLAQVSRFITAPLLHACWAGVVGFFIAAASCRAGSRWPLVVMGIFFAAVLHGLYDVFSGDFVGIGLAAVSILVFMGYLVHALDDDAATASR